MKTEIIARVCHEANKAFCEANGDHSQESWDKAEEWQKQSTIQGVEFALKGNVTPADQHAQWVKEKQDSGWVWGEVKDSKKKTHPCIVPYNQLPAYQQAKDELFIAVVNAVKDK